jgi:hypothetical protein
MTPDDTPRERLARLENEMKHVNAKLDAIGADVGEMKDAYVQSKGALKVTRWATYGIAGAIGYVSTYLPKLSALMGALPK